MTERPAPTNGLRLPGPDELRHYYELMRERDLLELEIRDGGFYLKLARPAPGGVVPQVPALAAAQTPPPPVPSVAAAPTPAALSITSPLAGVFYRSPAPNAAAFVKEGDAVAYGDVLCIVEAMKVMNEIRADKPGKIKKIAAENGKPVSAGQDLFLLEPA